MQDSQKILLIIDGHNLIRRAYEAIPIDDEVKKTDAAISSSLLSIGTAIKRHRANYFLMALDFGGQTFRHDLFSDYKKNRTPIPSLLAQEIGVFAEKLNHIGLTTVSVPGVEAEDVIATLSIKAFSRQFKVIVISNDKDLNVLTGNGIEVWDKTTKRDSDYISDKYNILPSQMSDFLALTGDTSDGVPGVPGVGGKTAAKLLQNFVTLESLIDAVKKDKDIIPGRLGLNIRENLDIAILSHKLTALKNDVDIAIKPSDLRIPEKLRVELSEFDQKIILPSNQLGEKKNIKLHTYN